MTQPCVVCTDQRQTTVLTSKSEEDFWLCTVSKVILVFKVTGSKDVRQIHTIF